MATRPSASFQQFMHSVAAPMTHANIEAYDLGALSSIEDHERSAVEDVLSERLTAGDGRAASALATLATQRSIEILKHALTRPLPRQVLVAIGRALGQSKEQAGERVLLDVLQHGDPFERQMAVNALQFYRSPAAESALLRALDDADASVRGNAFGSLIIARGLKPYDGSYRDRIGLTYPLLGSPLVSVRALARADVAELLCRLDAGTPPDALDLAPIDDSKGAAARWMESLRTAEPPWHQDLALDALDAMQGRERRWAKTVLIGYLHLDPRAARAAAHAGDRRAVEPLREVMARYGGAVQIEAAAALVRLTSDPSALAVIEATRTVEDGSE